MSERVLALAGLVQALAQVRRVADTGQANAAILTTAMDSGVPHRCALRPPRSTATSTRCAPGLTLLRDYFGNQQRDEQLPRLALAVMQLERRFVRDDAMAQRVQAGIRAQAGNAERLGSSHPDVLTALGSLYAETLSHLRPRVLVQGNPHYLGQAAVVAEVRAILLAAVRSAVLWRQLRRQPVGFPAAQARPAGGGASTWQASHLGPSGTFSRKRRESSFSLVRQGPSPLAERTGREAARRDISPQARQRSPCAHAQHTAAISAKASVQRSACSTRSDRACLCVFMLSPLRARDETTARNASP